MNPENYSFTATLAELDAGLLERKLSKAVRDTALAVVHHGEKGKTGKITLELTVERLGDSSQQVNLKHKLSYAAPTQRGKTSEEETTATLLYVGRAGVLTILPDNQLGLTLNQQQENA